ncbi:MAG TPA: phosphoribosylglycinamide formyltransferase [Candidatus Dormibacteraeota bacterium]|nr:phosphoribosylglycinamide formyltransferase [Candidatus Dormibacteraeota bacterium]
MARRTRRREPGTGAGGPPLTGGRTRIAVLVSGAGSNLRAILDACDRPDYPAEVVLVAGNRPSAGALELAAGRGVATAALPVSLFGGDRGLRDAALRDRIVAAGASLVVCAGYDQILGEAVLDAFPGALLNLHPSLLPAFAGGMHAVEDALDYGAKVTGCTVHFIDKGAPDGGAVILQRAVEVRDDDTPDTLRERVHHAEWEALPLAVELWCRGRLRRDGRRVSAVP